MNSTNIWKKKLNKNKNEKQKNEILNLRQFKSKKKKSSSNFLKENLITNWIENEEQTHSSLSSSIHFNSENEEDKDSLQIENLQYLSTMKNLIFLDLENFSSFFQHLTNELPNETYIMAFQSSNIKWKPPKKLNKFTFFSSN